MPPRAPKPIPPAEEYDRVFALEARQDYDTVTALEARTGYALDRAKLETAARILACPVKAHPPNWQHGRVVYAVTRQRLAGLTGPVTLLDIGTAKGFSALCLLWALQDAGLAGTVYSCDVIDPLARSQRNTVVECDGLKTLAETLAPWPEAQAIQFAMTTGIDWLSTHRERVHVAFVDGKHTYDCVQREGRLLSKRQEPGDVAIFDDLQSEGVSIAVNELASGYRLERIEAHAHRIYAVAVRR